MKKILTTSLLISVLLMPVAAQYKILRSPDILPVTLADINSGLGLSVINVPYSNSMFGFTIAQGVQIDYRVIMALGTGLSFYNGGLLIPLFADFRYSYYNNHRYTAYVFGEGGFLFNPSKHFEYTKLFLNPGAGMKYDFSSDFSIDVGLGLILQQGIKRDTFINLKMGIDYLFK